MLYKANVAITRAVRNGGSISNVQVGGRPTTRQCVLSCPLQAALRRQAARGFSVGSL